MLSWSQRVCPTLRALTIDQLTPPHVHNRKPVVHYNSVRLTALPIDKLTQSHVHTVKPVVHYNCVRFTALPIDNLKPSHVHRMKLAHENMVALSHFSTKNAAFSKEQNTGYEVSFEAP